MKIVKKISSVLKYGKLMKYISTIFRFCEKYHIIVYWKACEKEGNLEFCLAIENQVMPAVLHEIECFMEMQEMDFFAG